MNQPELPPHHQHNTVSSERFFLISSLPSGQEVALVRRDVHQSDAVEADHQGAQIDPNRANKITAQSAFSTSDAKISFAFFPLFL